MSRAPTGGEPPEGRPSDRHISLAVSHPSDDPSRHRVFDVRAAFDPAAGGWMAYVGEQDRNDQRGAWEPLSGADRQARAFPTAAACLGDAVAALVAMTDRDASAAAGAE